MSDESKDKEQGNEKNREETTDKASFYKRFEDLIPDAIKRTFVAGVGSVFMSEEGLRSMIKEMRLPKEAVAYILQHADNTKSELFRLIAKELRQFLDTVNFGGELQKILTSLTFEISMSVRFKPNDAGLVKPTVNAKTKLKKNNKDD